MTKSYLGKSQSQKHDLVIAQFILNLNFWRNTEDLKTPISQKSWIGSDFEFAVVHLMEPAIISKSRSKQNLESMVGQNSFY